MHTDQQFARITRSIVFLSILLGITAASARAADRPNTSAQREAEQIAVLRSDAPPAEKALACKRLAIDGSSEAVPELARLLSDPQLASWARIALEAIPGEEADRALREAARSLQGILLVGTVNSIGVRRDAQAVDLLTARLQENDAQVAAAAAVALGHIGNAAATQSLRQSLTVGPIEVRSAVAEGCVLCAERLQSAGKSAEAAEIYDQVRKADVPKQRIIEATRGAILARNQEGIPLLIELFRSPDKGLFQLALSTAREFPGGEVDKALAAELARATPERAALMIQAMADRPQTVVVTAVLQATQQGPKQVRLSAISALGRVGNASCLPGLLQVALDADTDLARSATAALAALPGEQVDSQIISLLAQAEGPSYPLLIKVVGHRRIDAVPLLLKALDHSDQAVRRAALTALGETVAFDNLSVLISQVVAPKYPEDATAAQQALKTASVRMPDRETCATELAAAIDRGSSVSTKCALLEILGAMGGTKALACMHAAAKSTDPELQDVSTRLLGEWMTEDAAPVLIDLAKTAPAEKYRVRALRGYIRIARQFVLPEHQRAEMCRQALKAARQTAEKELVLDVLERYPNAQTLELAMTAMEVPELKNQAARTVLAIAQKLGHNRVDMAQVLDKAGFQRVKLEIVKAEYGAGSTQMDVTAVLRKRAGDLPLINLESPSYNAGLGGDPLPGSVKQLRIRYRINGKEGEATFPENAPIILPLPK